MLKICFKQHFLLLKNNIYVTKYARELVFKLYFSWFLIPMTE